MQHGPELLGQNASDLGQRGIRGWCHAHGMRALPHERGIVNEQDRFTATEQRVRLFEEHLLQWGHRPGRGAQEVVQLLGTRTLPCELRRVLAYFAPLFSRRVRLLPALRLCPGCKLMRAPP